MTIGEIVATNKRNPGNIYVIEHDRRSYIIQKIEARNGRYAVYVSDTEHFIRQAGDTIKVYKEVKK